MKIEILRIDIFKKEFEVKDLAAAEKKLEKVMKDWYDNGNDDEWVFKESDWDWKELKERENAN